MRRRRGYAAFEYLLIVGVIFIMAATVYMNSAKNLEKTVVTIPIYVITPQTGQLQDSNKSYEFFDMDLKVFSKEVTVIITPKEDMAKITVTLTGANGGYGAKTVTNIKAGQPVTFVFNGVNTNDPALVLSIVLQRVPPKWM